MQVSVTRNIISSAAARAAVEAAVAHGTKDGKAVVAAVVDIGGELMALLRADGAFAASVAIAKDKAYTAAIFGLASDKLGEVLSGNENLREGIALRPGVVLFGGGYPIVQGGQIIGGIGVSGGSEDDDRACAKAGLAALGLS